MITLYHGANVPFDTPDPNRGLVADDKIVALMRRFQMGELTQEEILKILRQRPWRTIQYSFHTRKAIMCLCRKEVKYVD